MQFTQRCGKRSSKFWKKIDQNPEIRNKFNFFEGKYLKKSFSEQKERCFNKPSVKVLPGVRKNITQK